MDAPDLKAPQHYINRELSFLEFNQRVLDQAFDETVPLLERLQVPVHLVQQPGRVLRDPGGGTEAAAGARRRAAGRRQHDHPRAADRHPRSRHAARGRPVPLPERAAAAEAGRRRGAAAGAPRVERRAGHLARAVLRARDRAGALAARPGPRAPLPAHPEQEPQLHRAARGQGRVRPRQRARHRAGAALAAARGAAAGGRREPRLRAAVDHRAGVRAQALHRHQGDRLLPVPRHPQQRPVRRRGGDRRPAARARGRARPAPLRPGGAPGDLQRLPRGHGQVPAGAVRLQRPRHLPGGGPGEPQPPVGGVRPGAAPRPQVPDLHPGRAQAPGRRHRPVRDDPPEGRAARAPVRELRAGDGLPAPGGRRSAGAGHQADPVPCRARLAAGGRAGGGGECRQGRDRHRGAAGALRRGGEHRAVQPPAGGGRARHVRRGGLQDPRED